MPRARPKPLTATFLRHLRLPEAGQVEVTDGGCPGLRLRLATSVARWVLCCRDAAGRMRRFALGRFPAMGLKEARDAARQMREQVRQGRDPVAEAREHRNAAREPRNASNRALTLTGLLDAFAAIPARKRSWPRRRQMIEYVFKGKLDRAAMALGAPELQLVIDAHASIMSAASAVGSLKPVLRWGAKRGLVSAGIAEALESPEGARRSRDRVLGPDEIRAIQSALAVVPDAWADALRLLFWTGTRLNEVCGLRRDDVDLASGTWSLVQIKTGEANVIPLPHQALAMLKVRCTGLGAEDLIFTNNRGGRLTGWDLYTRRIQRVSGTTEWHRHDIRRSVATIMGDLKVPPHIIEVALGHKMRTSSDGSVVARIAQVYNRSRYRAEHADALQRLADELDLIASGEDKVVRLRA